MPTYVALLRAVNVGGTGTLPMSDLKAMCIAEGFERVRTYIASGNVVFSADRSEAEIKARLEKCLKAYAGRPVGVLVRTVQEMAAVRDANPFPDAPPNRTYVIFLDASPPPDTLDGIRHRTDEEVCLGIREIYVAYPAGMGPSKLKIPAASAGTGRNMNTVAKLAELASSA